MTAQTTTDLRVDVQEPAAWTRRLSVTVPAERVQRIRRRVTTQIAGNARLPGFRKGKMPQSLLEKQFGPAIDQETIDRTIQEAYREAIDSSGLHPINQGQVDGVEYTGGAADLTFHVQFEVQPSLSWRARAASWCSGPRRTWATTRSTRCWSASAPTARPRYRWRRARPPTWATT
jgi:FKBP-type peptidyl-prolyl cis-trans isomerase (trigger factor)